MSEATLFSAFSAFTSISNIAKADEFTWLLTSKFNAVFIVWEGIKLNVSKGNGMQTFFGGVELCFTESVLLVHPDDDLHSLIPLSSWTAVGKKMDNILRQ